MFDTLDDEMKTKLEQDFATFKVCKLSNVSGCAKMLIIGRPPEYIKESVVRIAAQNDIIVEFIEMTLV